MNIITSPPLKAAYIQILNVLNTNVEQIQMFSHAAVLLTNHYFAGVHTSCSHDICHTITKTPCFPSSLFFIHLLLDIWDCLFLHGCEISDMLGTTLSAALSEDILWFLAWWFSFQMLVFIILCSVYIMKRLTVFYFAFNILYSCLLWFWISLFPSLWKLLYVKRFGFCAQALLLETGATTKIRDQYALWVEG